MQIDVYSDVVCPWCYIGKRRLDAVLSSSVGDGVEVQWKPYQLYPNLPGSGLLREAFIVAANPGVEDVTAASARIPSRIKAEAEDVGLEFNFAKMEYMPNTLMAHRLLAFAAADGVQHELAEVLFRYYFCEGRHVGDPKVLTTAAASVGMDEARVREHLAGDEGLKEVERQLARGIELGVSGVPCFVFGGGFMLPGAQTTEVMASLIVRAKERLTRL